jgi:hypothetical protein
MTLGFIVLVVVLALLIGSWPAWPLSQSWGHYRGGGMGLIALILVVLLLSNGL